MRANKYTYTQVSQVRDLTPVGESNSGMLSHSWDRDPETMVTDKTSRGLNEKGGMKTGQNSILLP